MRSNRWCWTLNTPKIDHVRLLEVLGGDALVRYCVFQLEQGESGTEHFQGYLQCTKTCRMAAVKKVLGPRVHLERQRGTNEEARDYCRKPESRLRGPWEMGEFADGPGARTDLDAACGVVRTHGLRRLAETYPGKFVMYHNGFRALRAILASKRREPPIVTVITGPTGTWKTRSVYEDDPNVYSGAYVSKGSIWFDGYFGESNILLDEFDSEVWRMSFMLKLLDRYPFQVPCKGGSVIMSKCDHIYLVSNIEPRLWYSENRHRNAFIRRITQVLEIKTIGVVEEVDKWRAFQ